MRLVPGGNQYSILRLDSLRETPTDGFFDLAPGPSSEVFHSGAENALSLG